MIFIGRTRGEGTVPGHCWAMSTVGLTFHEARSRISSSLRELCDSFYQDLYDRYGEWPAMHLITLTLTAWGMDCVPSRTAKKFTGDEYANHLSAQQRLILVTTVTVIALLIASYATYQTPYPKSGLVISFIVVTIFGLCNVAIVALYRASYETEVYHALQRISNQYSCYLNNQYEQLTQFTRNKLTKDPDDTLTTLLPTGHSQISIYSVFRSGQWVKLPVLLLAEGDIVSLMGGDLTPCKVVELRNKRLAFPKALLQAEDLWEEGSIIDRGSKIHILPHSQENRSGLGSPMPMPMMDDKSVYSYDRDSQLRAAPSTISFQSDISALPLPLKSHSQAAAAGSRVGTTERHRCVDPESIEILRLCGNTRCFRLLETPMRSFVLLTFEEQQALPMQRGSLFLHKLKRATQMRTLYVASALCVLVIIVALIRTFLEPHMETHFTISLLEPLATTVILFAPMSSPSFSLLIEALGTAETLSTLEVAHDPEDSDAHEGKRNVTKSSLNSHAPFRGKSRADQQRSATSSVGDANIPLETSSQKNKTTGMTLNPIAEDEDPCSREDAAEQENNSDLDNEEFIDEDLDARVEDIAEETAERVHYFRFFNYVLATLHARLLGGWALSLKEINMTDSDCERRVKERESQKRPLLPIPLCRTNVVSQLGAITMVCFVDDDVVSENYSVTEEIFLLNENQEQGEGDTSIPSQETTSKTGWSLSSRRFGSTADGEGGHFNPALTAVNSVNNNNTAHSKLTVLDLHANPEATGSRFENPNWWRYLPCLKPMALNALLTYKYTGDNRSHSDKIASSSSAQALFVGESSSAKSSFVDNSVGSPPLNGSTPTSQADIEKALVRHIRKTLPLEFLRELAEEIGFVEDDLSTFVRALEVNVLAPGLENAHLQEDNHQWGQEESRRRGSLLPQLRGAIYKDQRGGSLQLMSLGDPSLVLHYSREYWDGSTCSIVPLAQTDRNEVLAVYDRWRLEDFDVMAFSYSPMPATQLQSLLPDSLSSTTSRKRSASNSFNNLQSAQHLSSQQQGTSGVFSNAVFFVDPSSSRDLLGRKARIRNEQLQREKEKLSRSETEANPPAATALNAVPFQPADDHRKVIADTDTDTPALSLSMPVAMRKDSSAVSRHYSVSTSQSLSETIARELHVNDQQLREAQSERCTASNIESGLLGGSTDVTPRMGILTAPPSPLPSSFSISLSPLMPSSLGIQRSASDSNLLSKIRDATADDNVRDSRVAVCATGDSTTLFYVPLSPSTEDLIDSTKVQAPVSVPAAAAIALRRSPSIEEDSVQQPTILRRSSKSQLQLGGRARASSHSDVDNLQLSLQPLSKEALLAAANGDLAGGYSRRESLSGIVSSPPRQLSGNNLCRSPSLSVTAQSLSAPAVEFSLNKEKAEFTNGPSRHHHTHGRSHHHSPRTAASREASQQQKAAKRLALRQLWSLMRQQIFLGMVASSVPVKKDVPNMKEDLDAAGIRFVYFSPQNMKRSKSVAEKIGIPFDWNCAISLRVLDSEQHDPHRHISHYADWDVLARMPHGIQAIKEHIKTVDNVPLLVSLFTDATPDTTQQMIQIFRDNGEVVLTIGAAYRAYNQRIFRTANIACSTYTLPNVMSFVPSQEQDLLDQFPTFHSTAVTKCDLKLSFDLIGLGTLNLLQAHSFYRDVNLKCAEPAKSADAVEHLRLNVLLETIRKGRVLLLNEMQAMGFTVVSAIGLAAWPLLSHAVPISMPPSCPPPIALLFALVYIPCIALSMMFNEDHEGVMRNTPRKSSYVPRSRDESRFRKYLVARAATMLFCILVTGVLTNASVFRGAGQTFTESLQEYHSLSPSSSESIVAANSRGFWLVQDVMSAAAVLSLIGQSFSMLGRGQHPWKQFPSPGTHVEYYAVLLGILLLHALVLWWRAALRNCSIGRGATEILVGGMFCDSVVHANDYFTYSDLHFSVWLSVCLSLLLNGICGFVVNSYDRYHYRRYTQFLRLEFDTRLGMHSPR